MTVVFTRYCWAVSNHLRSDVLMSILRLSKWASFLLLYKPSWSTTSRPHRSYSELLLSWKIGNALFISLFNWLFCFPEAENLWAECNTYLLQLGNCMFMKTRAISLGNCKLRFVCFGDAYTSKYDWMRSEFRKASQLSKAVKCDLTESKCL